MRRYERPCPACQQHCRCTGTYRWPLHRPQIFRPRSFGGSPAQMWFLILSILPLMTANLDNKLANVDSGENFVDNLDALCIRNHCIVFSSDVEVTLVELPKATAQYTWIVSSVHLRLAICLRHFDRLVIPLPYDNA